MPLHYATELDDKTEPLTLMALERQRASVERITTVPTAMVVVSHWLFGEIVVRLQTRDRFQEVVFGGFRALWWGGALIVADSRYSFYELSFAPTAALVDRLCPVSGRQSFTP